MRDLFGFENDETRASVCECEQKNFFFFVLFLDV